MRTIKFRGKQFNNGKWVYGYLADGNLICTASDTKWDAVEVKSTTVGQFTGLTDKAGREIYEGDIVVTGSGFYGVIKWSKYGYFYIHSDGDKEDPLDYAILGYMLRQYDFEVVGNIHDNPELLKGGNNETK